MSRPARRRTFSLHCRAAAGIGPAQVDVMLQSLALAIDERGLALLRGAGDDLSFTVAPNGRNVTESDRRALAQWAVTRNELADYRVGPLGDSP
jgi:hypothetical protein